VADRSADPVREKRTDPHGCPGGEQHFVIGRGHYHVQHEPCWYAVRKTGTGHWSGDRTQSTLWQIKNAGAMGGTRDDATSGLTGWGAHRRAAERRGRPQQFYSEGWSREEKAVPMATMPRLLSLCPQAVSIDESPVDLEAEAGSVVEVQVTVAQFRMLTKDAVSQRISLRPTV
jgi:hypothetical protein